jgi:hypothetical protein
MNMRAAIEPDAGNGHGPGAHVPLSDHLPARRFGMRCPHCRTPGDIRTSVEEGATIRLIYFSCRNPACGHAWRASLIYDYGLSPSAIPDPALADLRMRPIPRSEVLRAMADAAARADPDQPGLFDPDTRPATLSQEPTPCRVP